MITKKHERSLKTQLGFIISSVVIFVLLILTVAFKSTLTAIEEKRLLTSLQAAVQSVSAQLDNEYSTLLHISQLMSSEGSIGKLIQEYQETEQQYDKIVLTQTISEEITFSMFSNPSIVFATYLDLTDEQISSKFTNITLSDDLTQFLDHQLTTADLFSFYPLHQSHTRFVNRNVISVLRKFSLNDQSNYIYIELQSSSLSLIDQLISQQEMNHYYLQVDSNNRIQFSTLESYTAGDHFDVDLKKRVGDLNGYRWVSVMSRYGYHNLLLVTEDEYYKELNTWKTNMLLAGLLLTLLTLTTVFLMHMLIYKPLKSLESEIEQIGDGNLSQRHFIFQTAEYNKLFRKFNGMKANISDLMQNISFIEKEKSRS